MNTLTPEMWKTIKGANQKWNNRISYKTDMENYGKREDWRVPQPDEYGRYFDDCDGYAAAKIKELRDDGIEAYFALCYCYPGRENPGRHAVCLVPTDYGDYILDNRHEMVFHYDDCNYKWRKREMEDGSWKKITA